MKEKNNFDIVRLVMAFIVLLVHSAEVTRNAELRFLTYFLDSDFAVKGFFVISGFLIAKSYIRSSSLSSYITKRCKRILPAYIFTIIMCLIIGVFVTSLPLSDFITNKETIKYILANFSFMNFIQPSLPGVFEHNPNQPMDGSLWTIKSEIALYVLLPFLIPLLKKKPLLSYVVIYLISCAWFYFFTYIYSGGKADTLAKQFISLSSYFFFGTLLATNENIFKQLKIITIVSLVIFFVTKKTELTHFIQPIAYSSVVILFCTGVFKEIPIGKYGDFSYGLYLYHWPVIQILIYLGIYDRHPFVGLLLTILISLTLAILSWNFLENRFLKRKKIPEMEVKTSVI